MGLFSNNKKPCPICGSPTPPPTRPAPCPPSTRRMRFGNTRSCWTAARLRQRSLPPRKSSYWESETTTYKPWGRSLPRGFCPVCGAPQERCTPRFLAARQQIPPRVSQYAPLLCRIAHISGTKRYFCARACPLAGVLWYSLQYKKKSAGCPAREQRGVSTAGHFRGYPMRGVFV